MYVYNSSVKKYWKCNNFEYYYALWIKIKRKFITVVILSIVNDADDNGRWFLRLRPLGLNPAEQLRRLKH